MQTGVSKSSRNALQLIPKATPNRGIFYIIFFSLQSTFTKSINLYSSIATASATFTNSTAFITSTILTTSTTFSISSASTNSLGSRPLDDCVTQLYPLHIPY